MNQKIKKGIIIGTLLGLGLCATMLILTIFKLSFFEGTKLNILITTACVTVGGYFSISSYNVLTKHRILGIVSFCLIWLSVLLVSISFKYPAINVSFSSIKNAQISATREFFSDV